MSHCRNKSGQAQCVGEECEVWCGCVDWGAVVGGGVVFVVEILCKHAFLWVCTIIMDSPVCLCFSHCASCYLGHRDI